ncbi:MAG: uroporphyrinogen-III synthase [Thermodesulfovibrionia bacterium]|nr:uroporphyrinogen-III synthase [Thermodesulfovibrionia bacterium]
MSNEEFRISKEHILTGKRILVPPARPESNPLLSMLQKYGAEVLEFPRLITAPPSDYSKIDNAIKDLGRFDWIIFSGRNCVVNFMERFKMLVNDKTVLSNLRIAAIAHGTVSALKKEGMEISYNPNVHTARDVIDGFERVSGVRFLLVRVEDATMLLPERLKAQGADVTEVDGYRMLIETGKDMADKVFGSKLDAIALTNPSAVKFFLKGASQSGLNIPGILKGVTIAAVGPATSMTAGSYGLTPDIVSKGHIANLRDSLIEFFMEVQPPYF